MSFRAVPSGVEGLREISHYQEISHFVRNDKWCSSEIITVSHTFWQSTPDQFESLVDEAIEQIPEYYRNAIDNLAIVVEELPDHWTMQAAHISNPYQLLGFYHGVPITQRHLEYGNVAPDRISIYRRPILAQCQNDDEVRALVHHVVQHEVAHYFGIDDDRLMEIGAY